MIVSVKLPLIRNSLPSEPEKVPTFENSLHPEYFSDLNDSSFD